MRNKDVINVGFILSLVENKGGLCVEKLNIPQPTDILQTLDSFEDFDGYDVFDVQQYASKLSIDKGGKYKYCWPFEYKKAFIEDAMFPKEVTREEYNKKMVEIKNRIEIEYKCQDRAYLQPLGKKINEEQKNYAEFKSQTQLFGLDLGSIREQS